VTKESEHTGKKTMSTDKELQDKIVALTKVNEDLTAQLEKDQKLIASLTKDTRKELIKEVSDKTDYSLEQVEAFVKDAKPMVAIKILKDRLEFIEHTKTSTASVRGGNTQDKDQGEKIPGAGWLDQDTGEWIDG